MEPAIFLDRDNTLIENDSDLGDPDGVRLCPGVPEGLKALREAGFRLVVVSNQGGVARGMYTESDVDAVHQRIACLVDEAVDGSNLIDRFYYCPFHPAATVEAYRREHPWRKPNPGMILQAARDMRLDLERSWMIGDQMRDVDAGRTAGCKTALINGKVDVATETPPTVRVQTFTEAVEQILRAAPYVRRRDAGQAAEALEVGSGDSPLAADANAPVAPAPEPTEPAPDVELRLLRGTMVELVDELRSERMRRAEFTPLRMGAAACQLLVLLMALLGLLELHETEVFLKWFAGAGLVQLLTLTLLLLDTRG